MLTNLILSRFWSRCSGHLVQAWQISEVKQFFRLQVLTLRCAPKIYRYDRCVIYTDTFYSQILDIINMMHAVNIWHISWWNLDSNVYVLLISFATIDEFWTSFWPAPMIDVGPGDFWFLITYNRLKSIPSYLESNWRLFPNICTNLIPKYVNNNIPIFTTISKFQGL